MVIKETINISEKEASSYSAVIGPDAANLLSGFLRDVLDTTRATVITNHTVWSLHGEKVANALDDACIVLDLVEVPEGEEHKNLETVAAIFKAMSDCRASRTDPVIAVGGGVIGDLAGFVAASYMRGVPFINIATTLLAMADSSIGGKTGVDLKAGKNLVGAFYQPRLVIDDISFLGTLPDREFRCGLAEVIKSAFLAGGSFLTYLNENLEAVLRKDNEVLTEIVYKAMRFKADIVADDERDVKGKRAILNYGHTLGHALETAAGYEGLSHGEAVAAGMAFAARLSEHLGLAEDGLVKTTDNLIERAGLAKEVAIESVSKLISIMEMDKKNTGNGMTFVLLEAPGRPVVRNVEAETVVSLLKGE